MAGFLGGIVSSRHLKNAIPDAVRKTYLIQKGDARPSVRKEVLTALRGFQDGYSKRDPEQLNAFMQRLFPDSGEILLLGTDSAEWVRGRSSVTRFIKSDWQNWGDVRLAVDDAIVWSSGDVAWVATVGTVSSSRARPLRFSAVLTRHRGNWLFHQVHFQWDESEASISDLVRWKKLFWLFSWWIQYFIH